MSLSAALVLAAAAASAPAQAAGPAQRVVLATARAEILPSVAVRQASGLQPSSATAPRPQISRRGRTVLFEFQ
jgi:hypothetical protein